VKRPLERRGDPVEVADRVELRLVVEAHRTLDAEREIEILHVRGGEPELFGQLRLVANLVQVGAGLRVGVVRLAPQVAVDAELLGQLQDPRDAGLVRGAVGARVLRAQAVGQLAVRQPVQRAQLRGVVAACTCPHPPRFQHRNPRALALEQERCREPDDARAQHGHVHPHVAVERRSRRARRVLEPE
jgi:hypothetical protein